MWVNDIYEDRAAKIAADLGGDVHAKPVKADVTSPDKIARMRETTGPVDILVNNAGNPTQGFELKRFVDSDPSDWEYLMRLNLGAILHVTHAYLAPMVEQRWGRIVTIASDAGRKGERYQAIYGAAKAGAMGFIRSLAAEVGSVGRHRELRVARDHADRAHRGRDRPGPGPRTAAQPGLPVPRLGVPGRRRARS